MTRKEVAKATREKLNQLTVANKRLYKETAWKTNCSPELVEEIIQHVSLYSSKVIAEGAYETIMIPHFGKFRPRVKQVQFVNTVVEARKKNARERELNKKQDETL